MRKAKESNLGELIDWLDKFGWEKGLALLEDQNRRLENLQAHYFGDPDTIKEATKLSPTITKQNITLFRLKQMMKEKSLKPLSP